MRRIILSFSLAFCLFTAFAQSNEINISASFAQSIELKIVSGGSMNFTFTTLERYQNGTSAIANFQVASSTDFEVAIGFTPFTNADGDEIDLSNLNYCLAVLPEDLGDAGQRWNFATPEYEVWDLVKASSWKYHFTGIYTSSQGEKTVITPGPSGNAGNFSENSFFLQIRLADRTYQNVANAPSLLDQNIQPGTYTCTVTLTALPSIT
ncbi:MAG: hypothetical protein AAF388_11090 [Bacteroidota bacterium]